MKRLTASSLPLMLSAVLSATAAAPSISEQTRAMLDRTLGSKGVYVSDESAYRFTLPRADVTLRIGNQRLSASQAQGSWVTFSPSRRSECLMNGEFILLEDEVNLVISVALRGNVRVTGLGATLMSEDPRLFELSVNAEGAYSTVGSSLRSMLDEVRRIRSRPTPQAVKPPIAAPVPNAIDPAPLNAILSMNGTATDGIYHAAIGRIAILNDTPMGREMGIRTTISIFGTNERAFADAELALTADELQTVLLALRTKGLSIDSVRNHLVSEHPQIVFVRVSGQGMAGDLARALRYALEAQVGTTPVPPSQRRL
jgi:hypothetical protein